MRRKWKNLNPNILRQRVIIEGSTRKIVKPALIKKYLKELAKVAEMEIIARPVAYSAHELGFGGWVHWRYSGSTFYSYPKDESHSPLFTVDIYTCKKLSAEKVVKSTKKYLNAIEIVWKEITV